MEFHFGSGLLWGTRTDVTGATPVRFGALQDISVDFTGEVKELFAQNQFPIDVARGKHKIQGKAKLASVNALMYNNLYFGATQTTGQTLVANQESGTVPATPFHVTVANSANWVADLGVHYASGANAGLQLTQVPSGVATGQYSVAAGIYTFSTGDTGSAVYIDYTYSATGGYNLALSNPLMGSAPRFSVILTNIYEGNTITLKLNACIANKLTLPTKIDDYVISEFDFSAYADSSNNIGNLSMAQQ